jgi:membrane protease YdiL (CAAX protease family)
MMTERLILEAILQVGLIALLATFFLQERTKQNYLRILFFVLIYTGYQIVLVLPRLAKQFDFIQSDWNWEGKIFGIAFGILSYFMFRKYFIPNNFFTFKQKAENKKKTRIVSISVIMIMSVLYYFIAESEFDKETLAFQLTMPALDEEIMFRGILIGLLLTALPDKVSFIGNPSILLTGILFGLLHSLSLNKDYRIDFDLIYFLHTGIGGYVFGWLALKSRSIVLPIVTHGFTNFFAALATMIK